MFNAQSKRHQYHSSAFWIRSAHRLSSLILTILLFVCVSVHAQSEAPDEHFSRIYGIIEQADSLQKKGNKDLAKTKYQEAQAELQDLRKKNPAWNTKVVAYRLNYVAEKLGTATPVPVVAAQPAVTNKPTAAKTTSSPAPRKTGETAKNGKSADDAVRLLSAGAEPRRTLRLQPQPGLKQSVNMTISIGMDMGKGQAMKMPAMLMSMMVEVKSVSATGDINYEMTVAEAGIKADATTPAPMVQAMSNSFKNIKGLMMTGIMTDRGINRILDMKMPAGADPQAKMQMQQMKDSMGNMSAPFPFDAVGVGAKWEHKAAVKTQGQTIDQISIFEVVGGEGKELKLKFDVTQSAANQKIENPAMPGMKTELTKMSGSGPGEATYDLGKVFPVHSSLKSHTEMAMKMTQGGKQIPMEMKMDMEILLESK